MKIISIPLSLLLILFSSVSVAKEDKLSLTGGYFGITAKANDNTTNIGNPSAFRLGYQYPFFDKFEFVAGYSLLMADFAGSDLGYGIDLGTQYYPFTSSSDGKHKDPVFEVTTHNDYYPFIGLGFYQRQFQSVKNSYAGFGATLGCEKYYSEIINFKVESRFIQLAGAGNSTATEVNLLFGIIYKL